MSKITASVWTILLVLILMPALSCYTPIISHSPNTTVSNIPGYLTYNDASDIFSIDYPAGWDAGRWNLKTFVYNTTAKEGLSRLKNGLPIQNYYTIFTAVKRGQFESIARVWIDLRGVYWGGPKYSIDEDATLHKRVCPDLVELSRTPVTVDGREGTLWEWEGTYNEPENQPKEYHLDLYLPTNLAIWVVTCNTASDNKTQWQDDFNNIVRSLRINY